MTISSTLTRNDYTGSGSVGPYVYGFKVYAPTDLQVLKRSALGVQTILTYLTDYTVLNAGNNAGGSITLTTALAVGETLTVRRHLPLLQSSSLRNQGPYFPETVEDQLDRSVGIDLQQQDEIDRSIRLAGTYNPSGRTLTLAPDAGKVVTGDGIGFTMASLDSSATALPGNGRTTTTLSAYLANNAVPNVLDYAAVGVTINTGVADAYSAITAAINAAVASGAKQVRLPAGTYLVSQQILVPASIELVGDGIAVTILKASATMTSVVKLTGTYARLTAMRVDANRLASYGLTFATAAWSVVRAVDFWNAILDGVWGGITGINDTISYYNCEAHFNGSTFSTGTATLTSGSTTVTITGGVIPSLYRNGAYLRVPSLNQDLMEIDSITPGTPNSTITLSVAPGFNATTVAYELRDGSGFNMAAPAGDSNIWGFYDCYANGNALAGMAINCLYGPFVVNFQADGNLHGIIHGHRGAVNPTAPIGTQILRYYAESNTGKGLMIGNASGLTVSEPLLAGGTGTYASVDSAGLVGTRLITSGQVYTYDIARFGLAKKEYVYANLFQPGTLIAGGTTTLTVPSNVDCSSARFCITCSGDGAGGADPTAVRAAILTRTASGATIQLKNGGAATQTCTADVVIYGA